MSALPNDNNEVEDARAAAFAALLPLAEPTARALERVQSKVDSERELVNSLRDGWHVVQRATSTGFSRFSHGTTEFGEEYRSVPTVQRQSSPEQERQNLYMWLVAGFLTLRLKHEPVPSVHPGVRRLIEDLPLPSRPTQAFLTWDVSKDGKIVNARFACVDEPTWTIPLAELLAHAADVPSAATQAPGAKVSSKRRPDVDDAERPGAQG